MTTMREPDLFAGPSQRKALRPHQERAIQLLRNSISAGKRRPILQAPTGFGKTLVAAKIVEGALAKGKRVAFCVPAISLINQTVARFHDEGIGRIGVSQANHPLTDPFALVQVCSVQTIARRGFPEADVVIVDECHLQFEAVYRWMAQAPEVLFIGLSATPWARGLGKHWDGVVAPCTTRELIDAGYLSDYAVYAPSHPDLSGVKVTAGEYQQDELSKVMRDHKLVGDVVEHWTRLGNNDPTLVFAVDRAHARALQQSFDRAGIAMGYCDASTDAVERDVLFARMGRREIAGIVNVGTLTTGVDADVRTLVMARPTKSASLWVQIAGRALRTAPGKQQAIIIDHSDTALRLGLPCSITCDDLDGRDPHAKGGGKSRQIEVKAPKLCPKCSFVKPVGVHACPSCGFAPEIIRDVESAAGALAPLTGKRRDWPKVEKQRWWSEILGAAHARGKSRGWASHQYRARFEVWPKGLDETPRPPSPEVLSYLKSRAIAYAKSKENANAAA